MSAGNPKSRNTEDAQPYARVKVSSSSRARGPRIVVKARRPFYRRPRSARWCLLLTAATLKSLPLLSPNGYRDKKVKGVYFRAGRFRFARINGRAVGGSPVNTSETCMCDMWCKYWHTVHVCACQGFVTNFLHFYKLMCWFWPDWRVHVWIVSCEVYRFSSFL